MITGSDIMKKFIKSIIVLVIIGAVFYFGLPYLSDKTSDNNIKEEGKTTRNLTNIGYNEEEIEAIYEKLSNEEIEELLKIDKKDKLIDFIEVDYFKLAYIDRYTNYSEKNKFSPKQIVMNVNIGLDKEFYTDIKEVSNPHDKLVLVNKYNSLPKNFEANNLITFSSNYSYNSQKMEKTAAENIIALIDEARNKGYTLIVVSGYRTEDYQRGLYENSINNNGKAHADKYSARPGHSEHQTGLAVDISNIPGVIDGFEKYEEYTWVLANAHKYGFIERYPKGKESITGYSYEPWHYRYIGVEAATIIHNEQITFEEYAVKYLNY